ncbi:methyl-accepting chemotaxis protein [Nitrogeniibacter aestuarii]|uniref:methyl-accepting chemotaxis protein n=1 Tax=Nitrogeniibacter aestuarii TaxID=2815343 RepID=UPI001E63D6D5|nr:methyl-accepting chemotaxis protein [Nitrogeniibacter aestuarii]
MFSNLSIRWKTLGPVLAMGVITLVLAGYSVNNARQSEAITTELGSRFMPAVSTLLEADRDLYQVLVAERTWLVTGNDGNQAKLLDQINENRQQSADRVAKVANITIGLPQIAGPAAGLVKNYLSERAKWEALNNQVVSLLSRGEMDQARALSKGDAARQFSAMRDQIDQLTGLINDAAKTAEAAAESAAHQSYTGSVIAGLIALVILAIVLFTLPRYVLSPLKTLNDKLREVAAGGGNLSARLPVNSSDELGQMAGSFNQLLENLGSMFRQLRGDAEQLTQGIQKLEKTLGDIGRRSEALADISTSNAASIEEITVSVSHIADNSHDADTMARDTGRLTTDTAQEVATIVSEAQSSAERVRQLSMVLSGLDNRSQSIHGIVGAIREIADQTNLLALNAAIEAARAGEQGRGFAVVADEVRKLAERTGSATLEISDMLDGMRHETQQAVGVMEQTVTSVERSANLTGDAQTRIDDIGQRIGSVVERMSEIALSIQEQRSATTSIAQSTEDITTRVQETDVALQNARSTVDQLASLARNTQSQFQRFQL